MAQSPLFLGENFCSLCPLHPQRTRGQEPEQPSRPPPSHCPWEGCWSSRLWGTWPDMWRASFVLIKYGFVVTRQGEIGPGQPGRGEDLALDEHVSREQAATWTCVHVLRKDSGQAEELSFRPGGETQVEPHVRWWVTRDREGGRGLTHSLPEEHTHTHSHYLRSAQLGGYRSLSPYDDWGWGWVLLFPC